jgi:hypothetical protein
MNTKPDETTLALWLEDELEGVELAAFEAAMGDDAPLLARREAVRSWQQLVRSGLPAVEEPPYPDFFNSRIQQALHQSAPSAIPRRSRVAAWRAWWLPTAALAGMALTFWLGTKTVERPAAVVEVPTPVPTVTVMVGPAVYTPEGGVAAESFSSEDAAATVIVLEGLEALPDTLDFSETVQTSGPDQTTAGIKQTNQGGTRQ